MSKKFAVFDLDGTLIRWQMFHAIFDAVGRAGHFEPADYQRFIEARGEWKRRKDEEGFKNYEELMVEAVIHSLTKIPVDQFDAICQDVFEEYKDQVYRFTRDLIPKLKAQGYMIFAISGSPVEAVSKLADYYGFDDYIGTVHLREDGHFTGEVERAHLDKDKLLQKLIDKHGLELTGSIAVGDSEGDVDMLSVVEHPIAFNPSKKLFRVAQAKGWKVVVERKNMIFELEPDNGHYKLVHTNA